MGRKGRTYLCQCPVCSRQFVEDEDGTIVPGDWLTYDTHRRHQRPRPDQIKTRILRSPPPRSRASARAGPLALTEPAPTTAVAIPLAQLQRMQEALAAYAHIHWGLSREQASTLLYAHQHILRLALTPTRSLMSWNPPHDVRTAVQNLSIDAKVLRAVCCPKCYKQYPLDDFPEFCDWKEHSRCRKLCGEPLSTTRWTSKRGAITVARRHYSLQSFDDWLYWFLQRPGIEALLEKSWAHQPPSDGTMRSLWDTPAWQHSGAGRSGKLSLGVFYDAFNPLHNKIAGKVVSCGVIIFVVLNLPHELWRQPGNFYVAGFTPLPGGPTPVTISALLDPVINMLEPWHDGKVVSTPLHPAGRSIIVDVDPLVADKVAAQKCDGFGSHSAHYFCSDCLATLDQLELTNIETWTLRTNEGTREAAKAWTSAPTLKARAALFRASGVRGSSMHQLAYRDHVRYHTTGIMHNLYEGVLQHHFRRKWGFGDSGLARDAQVPRAPTGRKSTEDAMEVDEDAAASARQQQEDREIEQELDHLCLESMNHDGRSDMLGIRLRAVNASAASLPVSSNSSDFDYSPDSDDSDSDWDSDSDAGSMPTGFQDNAARSPIESTFDADEVAQVQAIAAEVIHPTWFENIPFNIGEKQHGKLKAIYWFNLFGHILPLGLIEMWLDSPKPPRRELLQNFCDLVTAVNLASSYTTTASLADSYLRHFVSYRRSLQTLWPGSPLVPNHHYAMHLAAQMKFWGPPMLLSEFPFESAIGIAQDIKTNNHYADMDLTMLKRMCEKQRLTVNLEIGAEFQPRDARGDSLSSILLCNSRLATTQLDRDAYLSTKARKSGLVHIPDDSYNAILCCLNDAGSHHQHRDDPIYKTDGHVLTSCGTAATRIVQHGRTFSTSRVHEGNSLVWLRRPGFSGMGFIRYIWEVEVAGKERVFVVLEELEGVPEEEDPFHVWPGLGCRVAFDRPSPRYIAAESKHLISHLVGRRRPTGTFGIKAPVIVLCNTNQGKVPE